MYKLIPRLTTRIVSVIEKKKVLKEIIEWARILVSVEQKTGLQSKKIEENTALDNMK